MFKLDLGLSEGKQVFVRSYCCVELVLFIDSYRLDEALSSHWHLNLFDCLHIVVVEPEERLVLFKNNYLLAEGEIDGLINV